MGRKDREIIRLREERDAAREEVESVDRVAALLREDVRLLQAAVRIQKERAEKAEAAKLLRGPWVSGGHATSTSGSPVVVNWGSSGYGFQPPAA